DGLSGWPEADDDIGPAAGGAGHGGDADAAAEAGGVIVEDALGVEAGHEAAQGRAGLAAEDLDVGTAAGAWTGDDVVVAGAEDIAGGDEDAAIEAGIIGIEAADGT